MLAINLPLFETKERWHLLAKPKWKSSQVFAVFSINNFFLFLFTTSSLLQSYRFIFNSLFFFCVIPQFTISDLKKKQFLIHISFLFVQSPSSFSKFLTSMTAASSLAAAAALQVKDLLSFESHLSFWRGSTLFSFFVRCLLIPFASFVCAWLPFFCSSSQRKTRHNGLFFSSDSIL